MVLSLDPVTTKLDIPVCRLSRGGGLCDPRISCGSYRKLLDGILTKPASSRIDADAFDGANMAVSTTCSCPRKSIRISPVLASHIRAV